MGYTVQDEWFRLIPRELEVRIQGRGARLLLDTVAELLLHRRQPSHELVELVLLDLERRHDGGVLLLRRGQRQLLGLHELRHLIVRIHGAHPLAQALGGARGLGRVGRGEVGVGRVRLADTSNNPGRDVVLGV